MIELPGCRSGSCDLAESGQRARAHPADVVGDLGQRDRDGLAARRTPRPARRARPAPRSVCRPCAVRRGRSSSTSTATTLAPKPSGALSPVPTAVPPIGSSPRRGSVALHPLDAGLDLAGVAAELLAERHRHGVHQVGAAGLDHGAPLPGLAGQRLRAVPRAPGSGRRTAASVAAMWVAVGKVSLERLRHVDVVVGVHRRRRWRAAIEAITSLAFMFELVPEPVWNTSMGNWSSCWPSAISAAAAMIASALLGVEQAEVLVDLRAGALEQAERADLGALERRGRDREVLHGALGLRAPQCVDRAPGPRPWCRARCGIPARSSGSSVVRSPYILTVLGMSGPPASEEGMPQERPR